MFHISTLCRLQFSEDRVTLSSLELMPTSSAGNLSHYLQVNTDKMEPAFLLPTLFHYYLNNSENISVIIPNLKIYTQKIKT